MPERVGAIATLSNPAAAKLGQQKSGLGEPRGAGTRSKYISSRRSVVLAIIALLVEATCCSSAAKATG